MGDRSQASGSRVSSLFKRRLRSAADFHPLSLDGQHVVISGHRIPIRDVQRRFRSTTDTDESLVREAPPSLSRNTSQPHRVEPSIGGHGVVMDGVPQQPDQPGPAQLPQPPPVPPPIPQDHQGAPSDDQPPQNPPAAQGDAGGEGHEDEEAPGGDAIAAGPGSATHSVAGRNHNGGLPYGVKLPNLPLPTFSGLSNECVLTYFDEIESMARIYNWPEGHILAMALHGLKGRAHDWMKALDSSSRSSYRFFRSRLTDIFKDKRPDWQKHKDIFTIKQQKGQTALDYAGQLRGKQRSYGLSDEILTSVFISGLEANLANVLAIQNPASFSEAVDMASRLESVTTKGKVCSAVEASPLVGYEEILAALSRIEKSQQEARRRPQGFAPARPTWGSGPRRGRDWGPRIQNRQAERSEDGDQYCPHHNMHGHSAESCRWLQGRQSARGRGYRPSQPPQANVRFSALGNAMSVPRARRF